MHLIDAGKIAPLWLFVLACGGAAKPPTPGTPPPATAPPVAEQRERPGDDATTVRRSRAAGSPYRIVGMPDRDFSKVPDHREASYATIESVVLRETSARQANHGTTCGSRPARARRMDAVHRER